MRKYLMMIVSVVAALLLVACQPEVKGYEYDFSQDNREPTKIVVWVDDDEGFMMKEMIEEFNLIHPNIIVEWAHMGAVDAINQLQMSGPSGNGADVFQFPHDQLARALRHDLLLSLPDRVVESLRERINPTALQVATACYDNKKAEQGQNPFDCETGKESVFAVPIAVESVALFYNKDLIDEPAKTWDELLEKGYEYLEETGNFYFNTNWNDSYFINFILSAHGYIPFGKTMKDPDNVGLNSQEVINALKWLRDNIVPYYGSGSNAGAIQEKADSSFEEGTTPYIITGPWRIATYKSKGLNVGVTTIPSMNIDGKEVMPKPFMGAQMLGVYKESKKVEAALTFIEFWNSDKGLEIQFKHKGRIPALKEEYMKNIPGVKDDELVQGIIEQLQYTIPMPTIAEVDHYWEPVRIMINDVWSGGLTPEEAAQKAENGYNQRRNLTQGK